MLSELPVGERMVGRIPVRNLWLLMLYASELTRFRNRFNALVEANIDELPDLVARLLVGAVEYRLRRNLTRGYQDRRKALTRVRGRIDILATEAKLLPSKGEVFCRFQDLTIDKPRNRLVRAALDLMKRLIQDEGIVGRCRATSCWLARLGVGGLRPPQSELTGDQICRNDTADRLMIALAQLAFDSGTTALVEAREERSLGSSALRESGPGFRPGRA
jgi:5-methylcytosine-specific restriction enzyme subunit McrC